MIVSTASRCHFDFDVKICDSKVHTSSLHWSRCWSAFLLTGWDWGSLFTDSQFEWYHLLQAADVAADFSACDRQNRGWLRNLTETYGDNKGLSRHLLKCWQIDYQMQLNITLCTYMYVYIPATTNARNFLIVWVCPLFLVITAWCDIDGVSRIVVNCRSSAERDWNGWIWLMWFKC